MDLRIIDVLILSDKHKGGRLGGVLGVTRSKGLHLRERIDREEAVLNTGLYDKDWYMHVPLNHWSLCHRCTGEDKNHKTLNCHKIHTLS